MQDIYIYIYKIRTGSHHRVNICYNTVYEQYINILSYIFTEENLEENYSVSSLVLTQFCLLGVQVQTIPEDALHEDSDNEDKVDKDERLPQKDIDKRIAPENEFSDSEDEGEGGRRDQRSYKGRKRQRLDKGIEGKDSSTDDKQIKDEIKSEKGMLIKLAFCLFCFLYLFHLL